MSGIQTQTQTTCHFGGFYKRRNGCFLILRISGRIGFGIEFHPVGTSFGSILYHLRIRRYKYRSTDACIIKGFEYFGQKFQILLGIPACIRSQLSRTIRNQSHLMRLHFQYQINKFGGRISFDIKFSTKQRAKIIHIPLAYMTFIRAWMYGNSFRTKAFTIQCYFHHIRDIPSTRITQRRNLVYVYT